MAENVKRKSGLFVKETKFHVNRYCNDKTSIDLNASASNKKLNFDILPPKYKEKNTVLIGILFLILIFLFTSC